MECSCHQDCDKTGNCCFPSHQHSNTDNDINETIEYETSCLSPVIMSPLEDLIDYHQKYNIITSVKMPSKYDWKNPMSEEECGHQNIAHWGSFYPAFSKTKNRLYKNIACAILDGSSDAIQFDVYVICERYEPNTIDLIVSNFVENGSILNSNRNKCSIKFKYPGDSKDIKWHLCYSDLVNSCPATFTIRKTENVNTKQEEMTTECEDESDESITMYGNVFCHVCEEDGDFRDGFACVDDDEISRKPLAHKILLDTSYISKLNRKDLEKEASSMTCRVTYVRISR